MFLARVPGDLRVRGRIGDDPLEPEILGVLRKIVTLRPLLVRQIGEAALQLHKCLLLDFSVERKAQLTRKGMRFGVEVMRLDILTSAPLRCVRVYFWICNSIG